MTQWILASNNQGKLTELNKLLSPLGISLTAQAQLGIDDADETGLSFIENAILKARHASAHGQLPAIADDSGLCVDALQGAPGIYSARYCGEHGNDAANNNKLLQALAEHPSPEQRGAHFICALAFVRHAHDSDPLIAIGKWPGQIASESAGVDGFGYDPLFYVPSEQCTAAELGRNRKNQISHRAIAMQQLLSQLNNEI